MSTSNLRIICALVFSVAFHGFLISSQFGPVQSPVAGIRGKKVSVRLLARQAVNYKKLEKPVSARAENRAGFSPVLPETVEVAVKEIPPLPIPDEPVVPEVSEIDHASRKEEIKLTEADSAESLSEETVLARPLYLDNPPPEYPALARRRHWQGTVVLEVMVSRGGEVLRLQVHESSGREVLDEAALKAVSDWRFEPGRRGHLKVDMEVLVPVRFSIR